METHHCCPDDIVMEILTYLPAISLMRFKCVSKTWNTLIQHSVFVKSHYVRSQHRPSATRILFQLKTKPNYHDEQKTHESQRFSLELDYFCHKAEMTICTNHCNGLVCLYSYKDHQLYLYNVTTREIKALPRTILPKQFDYPRYTKLFLGFDQVTEKYKLLCILRRDPHPGVRTAIRGQVLTLGVTNSSWRKSRNRFKYELCVLNKECVFINGLLEWTGWAACLAYFNFSTEKFGFLSRPRQPIINTGISYHSIETPLCGKYFSVRYIYYKHTPPSLALYKHVDGVCTRIEREEIIEVGAALFGAKSKWINDMNTKESHVLATASVVSTTAISMFTSSIYLRFVSSNIGPRLKAVSCFVENIIPLTSLLV